MFLLFSSISIKLILGIEFVNTNYFNLASKPKLYASEYVRICHQTWEKNWKKSKEVHIDLCTYWHLRQWNICFEQNHSWHFFWYTTNIFSTPLLPIGYWCSFITLQGWFIKREREIYLTNSLWTSFPDHPESWVLTTAPTPQVGVHLVNHSALIGQYAVCGFFFSFF